MIRELTSRAIAYALIVSLGAIAAFPREGSATEPSSFERTVGVVFAQGDTILLDSLVSTERFASYRYVREMLERYFDTGDSTALMTAAQVASAIERSCGDGFYQHEIAQYRMWREKLHDQRSNARRRFAEVSRDITAGSDDVLASRFDSLAQQFLSFGDSATAVRSLQYAGLVTQRTTSDKPVTEPLRLSLTIARSIGDLDALARSFNLVGSAYQKAGYSLKAGAYFDSSRVIRTQLKDQRGLAECLSNISAVHFTLDQLTESYRFAAEALRIRRQFGDTLQICQSLLNMIGAFRYYRSLEEVEEWLHEARMLSAGMHDVMLRARVLQADGMIAEENGASDEAEAYYDSALAMAEVSGGAQMRFSLLTRIAMLHSSQGDFEGALRFCLQAEDLAEKTGNQAALAAAWHNIGSIQQQLGDVETAVKYFHRALELRQKLILPNEMVETLSSLGEIYIMSSDLPTAEGYYHQAAQIAGSFDNPNLLARVSIDLARLSQRRGDYRAAARGLDSALAIYQLQSNKQKSLEVLIMHADFARLTGDFAGAERYLASAAVLLKSSPTYGNEQRYEIVAGMLWYNRGEIDSAFGVLARVIKRLEQSRRSIPDAELRASQMGSNRYLYETVVSAIAMKYERFREPSLLDSLICYVELAKSRSLLEALETSNGGALERIPADLRNRERTILQQIEQKESEYADTLSPAKQEELRNQVTELETALAEIRLRESLTDPHANRASQRAVSLSDLSAHLTSERAAVLDYLLAPEQSFLIVISDEGTTLHKLPGRQKLTQQIADYSALLQKSVRDEALIDSLKTAATALAKVVLSPVIDKLSQIEELYIISDGALSLLPFESLIINGKYLIEVSQVAYIPSMQQLSERPVALPPGQPRILVIADPQPSDKLSPLPYSRKEAQWIAEQFPTDRCNILAGKEAVRSTLLSAQTSKYDVIHFATHSTVDRDDPLRSRIWLSPDTTAGSSDYLSLRDILRLSLPVDLVVLSSCESGGGRFQLGEGIEGFVGGFMTAGSRNVIVSLWDVEDFASAVFMKDFYAYTQTGYISALRQAKLSMIKSPRLRLRHPFFWAPYVLTKGN